MIPKDGDAVQPSAESGQVDQTSSEDTKAGNLCYWAPIRGRECTVFNFLEMECDIVVIFLQKGVTICKYWLNAFSQVCRKALSERPRPCKRTCTNSESFAPNSGGRLQTGFTFLCLEAAVVIVHFLPPHICCLRLAAPHGGSNECSLRCFFTLSLTIVMT